MKRYIIFVFLILTFLSFSFAQAGKPRPTPTPNPYLAPVIPEAYPAPPTPMPVPGFPDSNDPRPGIPYVWGWFRIGSYGQAWWVSIDGIGIQPDIPDGMVCITPIVGTEEYCDRLRFTIYDYVRDRNWYRSYDQPHCGYWFVFMGYLNGTPADIRQPNDWLITCSYLPTWRRG